MIKEINGYVLDTLVTQYAGLLTEFGNDSYEWAKIWNMQRSQPNEVFYWLDRNLVFGVECKEAIAAATLGVIYKISYRHHANTTESCASFRNSAIDFVTGQMGKHQENHELGDVKVVIWADDLGNVVLEADGYCTQLILTSARIRGMRTRN
jgi:hypothetical protein